MEPTQQEQEIAARLQNIFTHKPTQAKIVENVLRNRPIGWSRRSSSPYYNEKCGLEIKKVFDAIKQTGRPFCFRYDWFEKNFGLSRHTLYLRVNQSCRYLFEQMDPTGEYRRYKESYLNIERKRGIGVVIELKKHLDPNTPEFAPEEVQPDSEGPRWRRRMHDWLEDSDTSTPFKQEGLMLSPEEIDELKNQLSTLTNVMASITSHSVKLVKMNLQ